MGDPGSETQGNSLLVGIGVLLIAGALINWFVPEKAPTTVVKETHSREVAVERSAPSSSRELTLEGRHRASSTKSRSSATKKTSSTAPSRQTTVTTAAPSTRRSETLTITLLGLGFLFLVAGTPGTGISSFTGPAGVGFTRAVSSVSTSLDATTKMEERVKLLETNTERISMTVELVLKELIRSSRQG